MSQTEAKAVVPELAALHSIRLHDISQLLKPRLTLVVLFSTLAGFVLGAPGAVDWVLALSTLLGTSLVAAGSGALNQVMERKSDALMERTADRPLPTRRMSAGAVLNFGVISAIAGLLYLALLVNLESALCAALTLALYVFAYTPLKRVTSLNTLVGAVPGALPPLIGWTAAQGELDIRAWALFAIVFMWQLPHFLAIAWMYRKDYARAGLKMLSTVDDEGASTGRQVIVHSLCLLPVSLMPSLLRMTGPAYFLGATLLGLVFLGSAFNFALKRTDARARMLFLVSVLYLPLLLTLMIVDKI